MSKSETSIPDVYVRFFLGVVKGDKGSTEGPALAVRGDVLFELGLGDDSSAWDNKRLALRRADLKCAGETEDAFWAEEAGRSCDWILLVSYLGDSGKASQSIWKMGKHTSHIPVQQLHRQAQPVLQA